jgi:hypothetical protein
MRRVKVKNKRERALGIMKEIIEQPWRNRKVTNKRKQSTTPILAHLGWR